MLKMKTPRIPIGSSNQLAAEKKVPAILPSSGAKLLSPLSLINSRMVLIFPVGTINPPFSRNGNYETAA